MEMIERMWSIYVLCFSEANETNVSALRKPSSVVIGVQCLIECPLHAETINFQITLLTPMHNYCC